MNLNLNYKNVVQYHPILEMSLFFSMARCYCITSMARCYYYPWRDVITIHGEMLLLSMARCYYYSWRDVITIHGEMLLLSMARCYYYPWHQERYNIL